MQHELLRKLRLQIRWDGQRYPSVDVPLGDLFCNAFYFRRFVSRLVGRVDDVFVSRIPMPYRTRAVIDIINGSDVPVTLTTGVVLAEPDPHARYFHADWRATTQSGERFLMGAYTGSGHYLGCYLTAIGQDGSWNILEGDEWIQPDVGIQPIQYGTGLEDYFNGAYYYDSLFDLPFHGLTEKGAMRTDQYRFHPLDAVDFDHDFRMDIEFGDQNRSQGYLSSVVYWYGDAVQDCRMQQAAERLLGRPADRFELAGWMAKLFLLERDGLWHDAGERCRFLAARHAHQPWADLLRLRSVAYSERLEGIDAVRAEYERLRGSRFPPAARQAGELLWFHEDEAHALLGLHMRGNYTLRLNGAEVAEGSSHAVLEVRRLRLPPGEYTWEVEFEPTMQGSMLSFCLRTHWGDITSAGEWELVDVEPHPERDAPDRFEGRSVLPNMTVWQFEPNAHVGMQSGAQGLSLWAFWDRYPRVKRVRLRRTWRHGPAAAVADEPAAAVPERTAEELRAHATE